MKRGLPWKRATLTASPVSGRRNTRIHLPTTGSPSKQSRSGSPGYRTRSLIGVIQIALGDRVLDAVAQFRARPGACGIPAGLTHLGEVRTTLGRLGVPLHRGVTRAQPSDGDRDATEATIHRQQPPAEVAVALRAGGVGDRGGALRIVGEIS